MAEPTTSNPGERPHTEKLESSQQLGTAEHPFVVEWLPNDPGNPMNFSSARKWLITSVVTTSVLAVTLTSSAYSGSAGPLLIEFNTSKELISLGVSLFVLGFAVGPACWAPLSELYGRRVLFLISHGFVVAFVAASAGANSMATLLVFRFLSGTFGASPMTNSGGVIADLFPPAQRGVALSIFAAAPFMGPVLGPVLGGFVTIDIGWRWVEGVCAIFIAVVWILGAVLVPETYGPVLLKRKAIELSKQTGQVYISVLEKNSTRITPSDMLKRTLARPWILLFSEPIVLIASTYLAIVYGTIYMFLGAFSIVYQQDRGWNAGLGGLAFLGLAVGMIVGLAYTIHDNIRYKKLGKTASPESRLPPGMVGAVALPVGMFLFAFTNSPNIHWAVSIVLSAPFGFGAVGVFLSCFNYLMDSYTIYAASVLAATAMLRSLFGAAFPLFVSQMYAALGIHWASSIPAFLTLAMLPFPFVLHKYGAAIRMECKYAQEAAAAMVRMQAQTSLPMTVRVDDGPSDDSSIV
ncbi:unnamed protein product [Discula destructiva]